MYYIGGSNAYVTDCRNNNILNLSTGGFPIYVATAGTYSGDYNNLYSNSSYVGYQGGNQTTLLDWINITGQDNHSVRLMPMFLGDSLQSLKLFDYSGMYCPVLPRVPADIEGTVRAGNTGIGAYTIYPTQLNAATVEAYNFNTSVILGQSAPLNVVIANMGKDSLVSVNIELVCQWRITDCLSMDGNVKNL